LRDESAPNALSSLIGPIKQNEQQELSIMTYFLPDFGGMRSPFGLLRLSPAGDIIDSRVIGSSAGGWGWPADYQIDGDIHALVVGGAPGLENPRKALFVLDFAENRYWGKQVSPQFLSSQKAVFAPDKTIIVTHSSLPGGPMDAPTTGLTKLEVAGGSQVWSYDYNGPLRLGFDLFSLAYTPLGALSVLGWHSEAGAVGKSFLLEIAEDGTPTSSVILNETTDSLQCWIHSLDAEGNIYIGGRVLKDRTRNRYGFPTFHGFIAKLSPSFALLWCKELVAEEFPCLSINLEAFPDGQVIFTYVTYGDLPIIAGKLSDQGDLLWHRGYEFYWPTISLGRDSSIFFTTNRKYFPNGDWEYGSILAKTSPDGSISSCPQFVACLETLDMDLALSPISWEPTFGVELPDLDVQLLSVDYLEVSPYCGTPAPPQATFVLPDTICAGACISPDSLQNRLAHGVEWQIEGPEGLDSLFNAIGFDWCFDQPGHYLVRQTVWLLGCSESYERILVVLPPLSETPLGEDRIVCDQPPYDLLPLSERPLVSYIWDDGSTAAKRSISTSGQYALSATDGFCAVVDTVLLTFLHDTVALPAFRFGPKDTTICQVHFPYRLPFDSPYVDDFFLQGKPANTHAVPSIAESGSYAISVELLGCLLSDTLILRSSECAAKLYLPTAFSPNDDGVNDFYEAQGKDYELLALDVYDRWGGLLYRADEEPFRWDGSSRGKPVPPGLYLVIICYRNLLTGEESRLAQEVNLIR
jgi:gliding motility-associated-like protein